MSTTLSGLSRTVMTAALCVVSTAAFDARAQPSRTSPDSIPSHLLSDDERIEFCTQMRRATTPQEQRALTERMRNTLTPRAKVQGVDLPPWLLAGEPAKGAESGGSIPGLGCGSGVARPRAPAAVPARPASERATSERAASDRKTPTRDAPAREAAPVREAPPQKLPAPDVPRGDVPVQHDRGIAYVTGGVGQDEADALRSIAPGYNMRATFTIGSGEYLSGVAVQVSRSDGTVVLAARSEGPYFFARLPPGHYRLVATVDGVPRTRQLDIPSRGSTRFTMVWPTQRGVSSSGK